MRNLSKAQAKYDVIDLPIEFTRKKMLYQQIAKTDDYYIYKVSDGVLEYFEVFKRKLSKIYIKDDKSSHLLTPLPNNYKVKYPNDEDFGKWAWCCRTMNRVNKIIESEFK